MKIPARVSADWPRSWRESYVYDLLEFGGSREQPGYTLAYQKRFDVTMDFAARALAPSSRVLDIAAAQGNFSLALAERGYDVTWNDLRHDLEGYVRLKYEHGQLAYRPGNVFELEISEPFDLVLAAEVIEHVAHPDEFVAQLRRLVQPGGYAVITTPNGAYFRNKLPRFSACPDPSVYEAHQFGPNSDDHVFLLHEDELRRFARQHGWRVIAVQIFTSFLLNGHIGTGRVLPLIPARSVRSADAALQRLPAGLRARMNTEMAALLQRVD